MTQQHPITPPTELVQQWRSEWIHNAPGDLDELGFLANCAAQWGADQELEACCDWLSDFAPCTDWPVDLLIARRPKPPSLKRVALLQLDTLNADLGLEGKGVDLSQIRRALEQLND